MQSEMAVTSPEVSVVIATRGDRLDLLRSAIGAIYAQDALVEIEVIVVFDQRDPDESLLDEFPGKALRLVRNHRVPGLAGGRNTGSLAARGTWVAFCDDDDDWLPGKLRKQLELGRRHPEADLVTGGILVLAGDRRFSRPHATDRVTRAQLLQSRVAEAHPSTFLMRRERFLERVGLLDEELEFSHGTDYDLLLRAADHGDIPAVPEPVVAVRMHEQSYFGSRWAIKPPACDRILEKHPDLRNNRRGFARIMGRRAFALAAAGERRRAIADTRTSLRLNRREKRAYLAVLVALKLVDPELLMKIGFRRGRGI